MDNNLELQQQLAVQKAQEMFMSEAMNSCPGKTIIGAGAGFGLGALMGLFLSSSDNVLDDKFLRLTASEQAKITAKQVGAKALSTAKTFGVLSAVFSSTECITEAIRAKDDHYNALISGCITGAIISRSGIFFTL
jgi:import inner membrane translocase subunit TIM22